MERNWESNKDEGLENKLTEILSIFITKGKAGKAGKVTNALKKGKKVKSSADTDYGKNGAEHVSGKSPSKRNDHEAGRARNQRDRGGEKGDARRTRHK